MNGARENLGLLTIRKFFLQHGYLVSQTRIQERGGGRGMKEARTVTLLVPASAINSKKWHCDIKMS